MEYMLSTETNAGHIAVFDTSLAFQHDTELSIAPHRFPYVAAWLPDGTGFLAQDWDAAAREIRVSLVMLDGTARSLPFIANRVLGVLP